MVEISIQEQRNYWRRLEELTLRDRERILTNDLSELSLFVSAATIGRKNSKKILKNVSDQRKLPERRLNLDGTVSIPSDEGCSYENFSDGEEDGADVLEVYPVLR